MEYEEFIEYIGTLEFAGDRKTADAMIRAVLGALCSGVDPAAVEHLAEHLPEPLAVADLCGTPPRTKASSFNDYVRQIRTQFGLSDDEAFDLLDYVVRITHETVGTYAWDRFTEHLPAELTQAIRRP